MNDAIKQMLTSKKFIAAVAGTIVAIAAEVGLELPAEAVAAILSPLLAYIVGQGIADAGKERAKVEVQVVKAERE